MTNYNDGNWHGWNGGECPVHPETVVEILMKDSFKDEDVADMYEWSECDSGTIVAFRVIKEHKEPREWWIDPEDGEICDFEVEGYIKVKECFK